MLKIIVDRLRDIILILFSALVFSYIFLSIQKIVSTRALDFEVLWLGARDLTTGFNPYLNKQVFTGIGYPLSTLVFYIPFSLLEIKTAQVIFISISFAAILFSIVFSLKIVNQLSWQSFLFFTSLALLSFPTRFTLGMGQNNSVAFLMILLFLYFYLKGKRLFSGVLLGLSFSLKTIFAFFLTLPFLRKKWRLIFVSLTVFLVSLLIATLMGEWEYYNVYLNDVISPLLSVEGREIYYNQGVSGFLSRITGDLSVRSFFVVSLSGILLINSIFFASRTKNDALSFSLLIITLLLVDSLSWQHHFMWLIFPFIVLNFEVPKKERQKGFFTFILLLAYFLVSWNFKIPGDFQSFPSILLLSHVFYGTLILYFLNSYLIFLELSGRRDRGR